MDRGFALMMAGGQQLCGSIEYNTNFPLLIFFHFQTNIEIKAWIIMAIFETWFFCLKV